MRTKLSILAAAAFAFSVAAAEAAPVEVTYTVTGTSGDWYLNFTVTNNISINNEIYLLRFYVDQAVRAVSAPKSWRYYDSNTSFYVSNQLYKFNHLWQGGYGNVNEGNFLIQNGESLSGFAVKSKSIFEPTYINWAAYTHGDSYYGPDVAFYSSDSPYFYSKFPVFVGEASEAVPSNPDTPDIPAVPEPGSIWLVTVALAALISCSRKMRNFI